MFYIQTEKVLGQMNTKTEMLRMKYGQEGLVDWYLKMWLGSTPRIVRALQVRFKLL